MPFNIPLPQSRVLASLIVAGLFLLSSCGPDYIQDSRKDIAEAGWTYADQASFSFQVEDTTKVYNLWLEVGHTRSYARQNLYTRIQTVFPDGHKLSEVVSLELANKGGEWLGQCNAQDCLLRVPLQMDTYFNQPGKYTLGLEQYMRQDSLKGILSLRFMVENTGKNRQSF